MCSVYNLHAFLFVFFVVDMFVWLNSILFFIMLLNSLMFKNSFIVRMCRMLVNEKSNAFDRLLNDHSCQSAIGKYTKMYTEA